MRSEIRPHFGVGALKEKEEISELAFSPPFEDSLRRWSSASQKEDPHQECIGEHLDLGLFSL